MSTLAQPPLSVRTHYKLEKIPEILHQKVRTSASKEPLSPLSEKFRKILTKIKVDLLIAVTTLSSGISNVMITEQEDFY